MRGEKLPKPLMKSIAFLQRCLWQLGFVFNVAFHGEGHRPIVHIEILIAVLTFGLSPFVQLQKIADLGFAAFFPQIQPILGRLRPRD